MHGIPIDLPLQRFVGDSVCQIALGTHGVHFRFNEAGSIHVEGGKWQLHDAAGKVIDESIEGLPSTRECHRVHVILDNAVTKFELDVPHSFTLTFRTGHTLTIYDDSEQYESFSIQPDGIYI